MNTQTNMTRPTLATRTNLFRTGLILFSLLATSAAQAATPNLATVPWLGNPALPHQVYSGGPLVLQGVATDLDNGAALCISSATWDSGAGPTYNAGTNGYQLEATHTYVGAVGQPFTATLTVTLCDTTVLTDTMRVVVRADNQEVRVNMAIDKGLWNLHKRMNRTTSDGQPSGYWVNGGSAGNYLMTTTAGVVQAFEINNHREGGNSAEDPYADDVARGLRYILSQQHGLLTRVNISLQNTPGYAATAPWPDAVTSPQDPDANGNGYGLWVNYRGHPSYLGGQLMDALVASGTPDKTAETGQANWVKDRTYKDIVQDLLDGYSWGMNDAYGGWHYRYNVGNNDTSASHWWAIGVLAGEVWGLDAPDWVKNVQWNVGVPRMQRWAPPSGCYFGYTGSWSSRWGDNQTNVTAAGLIMLNADDVPQTDPRYSCASQWLADKFFTNRSYGNYYTWYQLTKAMRTALDNTGATAPITLLGTQQIDWYAEVADYLITTQQSSGAFPSTLGSIGRYIAGDMASSWALIMLSPSLFELPPQAVCNASPLIDGTAALGGEVDFDGSQSAHPDTERTIVSYSWAFNDGSMPGTATGETTSHSFDTVGIYDVVLTVEDDNGNTDTDICQIDVRDNDIPPNANPGGPYEICLGDDLNLDGSGSTDLDNEIVSYEWDVELPINFATIDSTAVSWTLPGATYASIGIYDIGLQVTDNDGSNGGSDHTSQGFTTVNVIPADDPSCNQPPVALCKDLEVEADAACAATASVDDGSYDPDGDVVDISETPTIFDTLGDNFVTLTIDDSKATDSCMGTVTMVDVTAPGITLNGGNVGLECVLDNYTEPGATAVDNCFDPISVTIAGMVDNAIVGSYDITYDAIDGADNEAAQAVRTVTVSDTIAPVITVSGSGGTLECNVDAYNEAGASVADECGASDAVTITGTVDTAAVGDYTVTYDVDDDVGNPATQASLMVTVLDTTPPDIMLNGGPVGLECVLQSYMEPGAVVSDLCSGTNLVISGSVDNTTVGNYVIAYDATDDFSNAATQASRLVTVSDTTAPIITLEGSDEVLECNVDSYDEQGAVVAEDCGASDPVTIAGTVDTATVGAYVRTYDISDDQDNAADQVIRNVTVSDTINPVIGTCADDKLYVVAGDGLVVLSDMTGEIVATDECALDSIGQSPVDGSTLGAGVHTLTFTATDGVGLTDACTADVTILERSVWSQDDVKVHFHGHDDGDSDSGSDSDSDSDSDNDPPGTVTAHCFTKLDLDGELYLRDSSMIPMDVRGPGNLLVDARVVVTLSGVEIADQSFLLDVKDDDDEKWEYKRDGGDPDEATKKLKIDWKEMTEYDSHEGSGLGDDVPQIETRFIGFDATDTKIKFKDVARPFTISFDDAGTLYTIEILDDDGTAVVSFVDEDMNSKKDDLEIELPFRLTPATTITVLVGDPMGGTTTNYPVDPATNYVVAGAKYMLEFDRTALSDQACLDATLTSATEPELRVELHVGEGVRGDNVDGEEVVGEVEVGPDEADWTKLDNKHWEAKP